jgi:hypothetical protein
MTAPAPSAQTPLTRRLRALLTSAAAAYTGTPPAQLLQGHLARLDEPLRVAIAGRLKAGKSTLLNALIGERLAATDAGECTRIVTWYVNGPAERAWAHPLDGTRQQIRMERSGGHTLLHLGALAPDELERLVVEVPSARLERLSLIDTPGIGSLSTEVSARTEQALSSSAENAPVADAVLYLMRHLHASDVAFLEAFHDHHFLGVTPVNAIGLLSRADEVGGGRTDALDIAGRIAAEYRGDARVRALVQTVLPVAGLLAEAATGLRAQDHAALQAVAGAEEGLLLSADEFVAEDARAPVPAALRRELLATMGLTGVRLSVALIRAGLVHDAGELARQLRRRSGLEDVRSALLSQFAGRGDLLKAQAALHTVERLLDTHPLDDGERLRSQAEAILAGAHELVELRLLNDLRTGALVLPDASLAEEAERLLGQAGTDPWSRLGLPLQAAEEEVRAAALTALRAWQRRGESPMTGPAVHRVAVAARRTAEGLLAAVPAPESRARRPLRVSVRGDD